MQLYVSIEGIIGCGKSTLLESLQTSSRIDAAFYEEPLRFFTTFSSFDPLYEANSHPLRNAAVSQMHIIRSSCLHYPRKTTVQPNHSFIISERSVFSPLFFIDTLQHLQVFTAFVSTFLKLDLQRLSSDSRKPDYVIFLDLSPHASLERMKMRNRFSDGQCTLQYETVLREMHMKSFQRESMPPVITVDVDENMTVEQVRDKVVSILSSLSLPRKNVADRDSG